MPDISGSTGDTIVSRTDNICGLMKIIFYWGKLVTKQPLKEN